MSNENNQIEQAAGREGTRPSGLHESIFHEGGSVGFLLAHSLGGSPAELRYVATSLARAGYTVSCPLLAGHGGSRAQLEATKWDAWYASIEEAHDRLRKRCEFIIVGGLSAGGVMTLRLAAQRPSQVHAITLFSPTLWPDGWAVPKAFQLFRLIQHKWFANLFFLRERHPHGIKDDRLRRFVVGAIEAPNGAVETMSGFHGGTIMEFRWMVQAVRSTLGSIQQPALIIHPRDDDRSSIANAAELQRRLGGMVETFILNDSYHVCTLDKQRDVVIERTLSFADRVAGHVRQSAKAVRFRLRE